MRPSLSTDMGLTVELDTRKRRARRTGPPRCCLCTRDRPEDSQTLSAERECFQRRRQGRQSSP